MLQLLRRLFGVTPTRDNGNLAALEERVARLERTRVEWELELSSLTDKLSSQLKRLGQRAAREKDQDSDEAINERIRRGRIARFSRNGSE